MLGRGRASSRRLWLGFGALTALLILFSGAVVARVRSLRRELQIITDAARPLTATTRELDIGVLQYAVGVHEFRRAHPGSEGKTAAAVADIGHDLTSDLRSATTRRQQALGSRFRSLWGEFHALGDRIVQHGNRLPAMSELAMFHELRKQLETVSDDSMQVDAVNSYNAQANVANEDGAATVPFLVIALVLGVSFAAWISVLVTRGVMRKEQMRHEKQLWDGREQFRVMLASIGDAVITTDNEGRITFLNKVAESLTGWRDAEALGQPLEMVFRIVNAHTRQPVQNPAARALKDGVSIGLANDTVLIRKDGSERMLDDSASPIRGPNDQVVGSVLVFRDVTERLKAEALRRASEKRNALIVAASLDAIVTIDRSGTIVEFNPAAEQLFGYSSHSAIGKDMAQLILPPELDYEFRAVLDRQAAASDGAPVNTRREMPVIRSDGSEIIVEYAVARLDDADQPLLTWFLRDITEQKVTQTRVAGLVSELSAADRNKDAFLATLGHELRGPLAPLRNALDIMQQRADNDALRQKGISIMSRQVSLLQRLADDLLDISRINRNSLELRLETLDLASVLHQAAEAAQPLCHSLRHVVTLSLPPEPMLLNGDSERLVQVFSNLLNNACKHTERGGRVSLTAERHGNDVVVSVTDNGVGISSEMLPRVFDMFRQGSPSSSRSAGLGIGLTIVRHLVEMHGGSVTAQSSGSGYGSTFIVRLPGLPSSSQSAET